MGIENFTLWVVILLLSVSTIVTLADALGFMPHRVSKWLNRNRLSPIIDVLKEFGIEIEKHKRINLSTDIKSFFDSSNIKESMLDELSAITIWGNVIVGRVESVSSEKYINLIGASVSPFKAELVARYLSTYWKNLLLKSDKIKTPNFDFIVTPKNGSPILGYEFAKLLNKPFALHSIEEKFKSESQAVHKNFDFLNVPQEGSLALIVDDSTTGGRMVLNVIKDLRRFGYQVTDCLVVFEPTLKNARGLLSENDVELHSIVTT